jgi:hypothetical protein
MLQLLKPSKESPPKRKLIPIGKGKFMTVVRQLRFFPVPFRSGYVPEARDRRENNFAFVLAVLPPA